MTSLWIFSEIRKQG